MAKKTVTVTEYYDDMDQKIVGEDEVETIEFSVGSKSYILDVRPTNKAKFDKAVGPFIEAAAIVSGGRGRPKGTPTRKPSSSGHSKETLAQIRDWAGKNGYEVSPRGRVAAPILAAWEEAHQAS